MFELLGIALYIVVVLFLLGLFLNLIGISLLIGTFGGIFVGIYKGFKNYFTSLVEEIRLRK